MLRGGKTETSLWELFEQAHLLVRIVVANRISDRQNQVGVVSDKRAAGLARPGVGKP